MSQIQWTDVTWNPTVGCTRVSAGCDNCYAVKHTVRLAGKLEEYRGLVNPGKRHFNGTVRCLPDRLDQPLRWRKPRRVFVNSMSDLFHPDVPLGFVDRVFAVMAIARDHVFQILTKRPALMAEYIRSRGDRLASGPRYAHPIQREIDWWIERRSTTEDAGLWTWPLRNVWLGASVEDQAAADERIPHLLRTPAAVRFLSCEPLLGPVELRYWMTGNHEGGALHWVIVGGESGPNARPCDVGWIRSILGQCREAGVPAFVKQLGRYPCNTTGAYYELSDRKGGDPSEWPEDLRVREWPS